MTKQKKKSHQHGDVNMICEYCSHCLPIGEGDHICDKNEVPVIVLSEYAPTEDYLCCRKGRWQRITEKKLPK